MTEASPSGAVSQSSSLTASTQGALVGFATGLSLAWAHFSSAFFAGVSNFRPHHLPGVSVFTGLLIIAGILWMFFVFNFGILRNSLDQVSNGRGDELARRFRSSRLGRLFSASRRRIVGTATLFLLVVLCVVLLAWYTLASGGPITSPFSEALLAMALLSPFVANKWSTPLIILPLVICSFAVVSLLERDLFPSDSIQIPDLLHILNTALTVILAVGIAVAVKYFEQTPRRSDGGTET